MITIIIVYSGSYKLWWFIAGPSALQENTITAPVLQVLWHASLVDSRPAIGKHDTIRTYRIQERGKKSILLRMDLGEENIQLVGI